MASILDMCDQVWTGGRAVLKRINDPLLLVTKPSDGSVTFKKAGSPGGFGYDSQKKCEQKRREAVLLHYGVICLSLLSVCSSTAVEQ